MRNSCVPSVYQATKFNQGPKSEHIFCAKLLRTYRTYIKLRNLIKHQNLSRFFMHDFQTETLLSLVIAKLEKQQLSDVYLSENVCRHHGGSIESPPETLQTITAL